MSVEKALDDFISAETPRTLVLQGTWGRGKTHLWKARRAAYIASLNGQKPPRGYAYVSLFGLTSIEAVRTSIGLAAFGSQNATAPSTWRQKIGNTISGGGQKASHLASKLDLDLPWVGSISQLMGALATANVSKLMVCIDDLERRGEGLRITDVLGLVSELHQQRDCSVLLIVNNESLGGSLDEWNANKEKVFQKELTFAPSSETCVDLVFPDPPKTRAHTFAREALIELGVTNIRIIERVRSYLEDILQIFDPPIEGDLLLNRIARSICLQTYCHLGKGEGAPSLKFAKRFAVASAFNDHEELKPEEENWLKILRSFGYRMDDAIDWQLTKLVTNGFSENSRLRAAVEQYGDGVETEAAHLAFRHAFDSWRTAFNENQEEVLQNFTSSFPLVAHSINGTDADSTFRLLRSFGADVKANELMELWMSFRTGHRLEELSPFNLNQGGKISDPKFIEVTDAAFATMPQAIYLFEDSLHKLGMRGELDEHEMQALAVATPEEIAAYLIANKGEQIVSGVMAALRLTDPNGRKSQTAQNVKHALLMIAAKTPYSADRIMRTYGVDLPPKTVADAPLLMDEPANNVESSNDD